MSNANQDKPRAGTDRKEEEYREMVRRELEANPGDSPSRSDGGSLEYSALVKCIATEIQRAYMRGFADGCAARRTDLPSMDDGSSGGSRPSSKG